MAINILHLIRSKPILQQALLWCNRKSWNKVKQAKLDISRRAKSDSRHHWIFDYFTAYRGQVPTNFHVTYIGDRVRDDIVDWEGSRTEVAATPDLPPFDCEYFEWTDILEAVQAAGKIFTMLELGAGYGRWTSRAALAAVQLGKTSRFGLVEGDPKHLMWLKQCMSDNGIALKSYKLFEGVVAGTRGKCVFQIELLESSKVKNWFGQAIATQDSGQFYVVKENYYGFPKMHRHDGAFIEVQQFSLSDVLQHFDDVDIVHMDIQGAEADAIQEGIRPLKEKVRRLNVGTHSHDIEARLRLLLNGLGWICLRDYPCQQTNETEFGPMTFVDGLQTWINPKLI